MLPSASVALAVRLIVAGALKDAPLAGLVKLALGAPLAVTVMLTGLEVVVASVLSQALAVST